MKTYTTLILIFLTTLTVNGQHLSEKIVDQPDGLTIGCFNTIKDTCLPYIFIGENIQVIFPCISKGDHERVDIASATNEINRLREILTIDFILKLNKCCMVKNCPDTTHGYYLMIKSSENYYYQYLDVGYVPKCGSDELNEIVELFKIINKNYR